MSVPHLEVTEEHVLEAHENYLLVTNSKSWILQHEKLGNVVALLITLAVTLAVGSGSPSIFVENLTLTMVFVIIVFLVCIATPVFLREFYSRRLKKAQLDLVHTVLARQGYARVGKAVVKSMHQGSENTCRIILTSNSDAEVKLLCYFDCRSQLFSLVPAGKKPSVESHVSFGAHKSLELLLVGYSSALRSLTNPFNQ